MELERVSLAIEKGLLDRFDALLKRRKLGNRSEAVRHLIRRRLVAEEEGPRGGEAVANLTDGRSAPRPNSGGRGPGESACRQVRCRSFASRTRALDP